METVFVMLSGGVDSSVAAARLIDAGYHVKGIFMKNWSYDRLSSTTAALLANTCPTEEDAISAKAAADHLGIDFEVINFEEEYWNHVVEPFFELSRQGLTPNPDVWCNQYIKFGVFLKWALSQGAALVATGHYAQVKHVKEKAMLLRANDASKDQSYFLAHVNPADLRFAIFPIGHLFKSQVRSEAAARGLPAATRKDSQGICFIGKVPLKTFLKERLPERIGNVVFRGKVIGKHDGVWFYTLGQRHIHMDATVPVVKGEDQKPLYVVEKNIQTNELFVDYDTHEPPLWKKEFTASKCHWYTQPSQKFRAEIEIRYHQNPLPTGMVSLGQDDQVSIVLDQPVRAVVPGQTVVFSNGKTIIGAGIINET